MFTAGKRLRIDCRWVCVVLVTLIGCRGKMGASSKEWIAWFDAAAATLPRWEASQTATSQLVPARTPDGLALRINSEYVRRNESVCWQRREAISAGTGWKDLCVHRVVPEAHLRPDFFLKPMAVEARASDQYRYEAQQAGLVMFGGRRAIVERALVSGGFEGEKQRRVTSVLVEVRRGEWALLEGRAGDDQGYEEFLMAASTIELAKP